MSLIQMFQNRGCLQVTPDYSFTYASGLKGPIYCDNRLIIGDTEIRQAVLHSLISKIKETDIKVEAIMAMATGAIALGSLIADRLNVPLGYVRSQKKGHGTSSLIEGGVDVSHKVLVVEDLINQGSSIKKGIEALQSEGFEVIGVLSIVNYEFDHVSKYFGELNVPIWSIIGMSDLLNHFENEGKIGVKNTLNKWHTELNTDN